MPVAKLKASNTTNVMKPDGNNSLDTLSNSVIRDPFLSFSRASDSPLQWIQFLHALDQPDIPGVPGWPLLTPLKVQMQKCEKCSREFFSSINYRRHVRVHHRMKRVDKDSTKNRDLLGAFWDKLHEDEAKDILSFNDMMLEEVPGSSIIKSLSAVIRKPGFSSLPQYCLRTGSSLLDIIQARPSSFPLSSLDLFNLLDDASEKTFLCGTALSMQKYIFDGEPGKIGLEAKNLVACTSFLLEQKLIKAWLADKDAEALRCQKLLMEEEEAAQRRQAELLERKRQKKLRQKEQKAKEQRQDEKTDAKERIDLTKGAMSQAERPRNQAASFSDSHGEEVLPDHAASSFGTCQHPETDEDVDLEIHTAPDSGQNTEGTVLQGNNCRRIVVARWHMPSESHWNHLPNDPKVSTNQKHESQRDSRHIPLVNGYRKWNRKPKPEHNGEVLKTRVLTEAVSQRDQNKKREVLIGSISVELSCHHESDNLGDCIVEHEGSMAEHQMEKKNSIHEKYSRTNSVQCGSNRSTIKLWRPVSRNGTKSSMLVVDKQCESNRNIGEDENNTVSGDKCLRSCAADDNVGGMENKFLPEESKHCGSLKFSSQAVAAFLAERWKKTMAGKYVKLVLSPDSEPPGAPAASSANIKNHHTGDVKNHLAKARQHESSTAGAVKGKMRTKAEKDVNLKYIPKQRSIT